MSGVSAAAPVKALIVGGGIGGLTAAVALQRAGMDPLVVERRPSLEEAASGAGVHLWSNALVALSEIGLGDQVAAIGSPVRMHRYLSWRGKPIGSLAVQPLSTQIGAPTVGVSRQQLHRVLYRALDPGRVQFDRRVLGFEQNTRGALLRFDDGSEETGDVVIGADGLHSIIRRQIHGADAPRYSGLTAWRALCDYQDHRVPSGEMIIHWGRGARLLHYHVSDGRLYWLALVRAEQGLPDHPGERKQEVSRVFRGWPAQVQAMLAATDESEILRTDISDRDPLRHWGVHRVTLLGDAAHPMTPDMAQGAGQAIEDAVGLARALQRDPSPQAALRGYEDRRQERANGFVDTSRAVCRMGAMASPLMCGIRDRAVLPMIYASQRYGPARKNMTAVI